VELKQSTRRVPFTQSDPTYSGAGPRVRDGPKAQVKAQTTVGGSLRMGPGSVDFLNVALQVILF
jgi:hypothetical protein